LTTSTSRPPVKAAPGGTGFFTSTSGAKLIPELVLVPFLVSFNLSYKLQIGMLAVLALTAFIRSHNAPARASEFTRLPATALLVVIALTFRDGQFKTASLYIAVFVVLLVVSLTITRKSAYESLLAGFILYLLANIVGWAAGFQSPGTTNRIGGYETSSLFFSQRIFFPFALSINETPYIGAAVLVAIIAMIKIRRRPSWYHWLGLLAAVFVLLGANNRTAVLLTAALGLSLALAPKATRAAGPYIIGISLLLPFYLVYTRPVFLGLQEYLRSNSFIVRGGSGRGIMGLEGRDVIWSASINFWSEHFPGVMQLLFGFGYQGHVKSGAYLYFPTSTTDFFRDRSTLHAHNSLLQALFDTGVVGAGILFAVVVLVVYRYGRSAELLPIFALTTMTALSGVVETNMAPGMGMSPAYLFLCLAFFVPAKAQKPDGPLATDRGTRGSKIPSSARG
jgi:branched-subunit amino acid transport protein AzlD